MNIEKLILKKVQIKRLEVDDMLYNSLIEDYSPLYVFLSSPLEKGKYIFFKGGELVEVFFVEKKRPYYFTTQVVGNFKEEGNYYLALRRPQSLVEFERRRFKRVKLTHPIKIVDLISSPSIIKGEILDLSPVSVKVKVKLLSLFPKNYLLQFDFKGETFNFSGYPEEVNMDLKGLEKFYSVYVFKFSEFDKKKSEKLEKILKDVEFKDEENK
jgi:c-di-GMP-binding flagellar brake protein YcgR